MRTQYLIHPDGTARAAEHVLGPCVSHLSWRDLFAALHASGNLKPGETVPSFQVADNGITFTIRSAP